MSLPDPSARGNVRPAPATTVVRPVCRLLEGPHAAGGDLYVEIWSSPLGADKEPLEERRRQLKRAGARTIRSAFTPYPLAGWPGPAGEVAEQDVTVVSYNVTGQPPAPEPSEEHPARLRRTLGRVLVLGDLDDEAHAVLRAYLDGDRSPQLGARARRRMRIPDDQPRAARTEVVDLAIYVIAVELGAAQPDTREALRWLGQKIEQAFAEVTEEMSRRSARRKGRRTTRKAAAGLDPKSTPIQRLQTHAQNASAVLRLLAELRRFDEVLPGVDFEWLEEQAREARQSAERAIADLRAGVLPQVLRSRARASNDATPPSTDARSGGAR